jgi:hypothetical protein
MPLKKFSAGPILRSRWQPELLPLPGVGLLSILELSAKAAARSELVVGRDRHVATVEQNVDSDRSSRSLATRWRPPRRAGRMWAACKTGSAFSLVTAHRRRYV